MNLDFGLFIRKNMLFILLNNLNRNRYKLLSSNSFSSADFLGQAFYFNLLKRKQNLRSPYIVIHFVLSVVAY